MDLKWFMLFIIVIKSINCGLKVDLRLSLISKGVLVHYGKFSDLGKYYMFIGEEEPIEVADFGTGRVFPPRNSGIQHYQLMIEKFELPTKNLAIIHSFAYGITSRVGYTRNFYEMDDNSCVEVLRQDFFSSVSSTIYLSLDIGPKSRHPFICRTVTDMLTERSILYRAIGSFNGLKLDGIQGPRYTIGSIYDSTVDCLVGYTKMSALSNGCDSVVVEYRFDAEKVIVKIGIFQLKYERRSIMGRPVWYLVGRPDLLLLEDPIRNAIELYDRIESQSPSLTLVTLDLSERITPEIFGIQKSVGIMRGWNYTLYELSKKHTEKYVISYIVDTDLTQSVIFKVNKNCLTTIVELFTNPEKSIVIVTSYIRSGMTYYKQINLFQRVNLDDECYREVDEERKNQILSSFTAMLPIYINIVLGEEPKSFYHWKELGDSEFKFVYYFIKDYDNMGNDISAKFIFGFIWEKKPYEKGNIPYETNKLEYRIVKENINTHKFLIRNLASALPMSAELYEIYPILN